MKAEQIIEQLAEICIAEKLKIATAESCTGGLVAKLITDLAGSSQWFERGFVTYSNEAKQEMIGVDADLIQQWGAVSEPVARAMAEGVLQHSTANYALSITGIAGPGGGSSEKPVGTVCFAWSYMDKITSTFHTTASTELFLGDRLAVRNQSAVFSLNKLYQLIILSLMIIKE